jgi:bifunctional DNA-binding transcriptional regulator/antitoxin component of YhaV-PrlF toxin-antitoxin module
VPMTRMEMNGRILVPKEIRKATGAKLDTRFFWELLEDGSVRVTVKAAPAAVVVEPWPRRDESSHDERDDNPPNAL